MNENFMEDMLERLKTQGGDPYRLLAAYVFGKTSEEVTDSERDRLKEAFYVFFHYRTPDIIKDCLGELRALNKLPEVQAYRRKHGARRST